LNSLKILSLTSINFRLLHKHSWRNKSISILNGLARSSFILNDSDKQIIENKKITNQFINNNSNLLITRADKGNITVALDKDYYFNKIRSMLQDTNTYTIINKDLIKGISSMLKDMLTRWKQAKYINEIT